MEHAWQLVDLEAVSPHAWRHGSGVTRELLVWPAGEVWKARMSVIDITAPGPFPAFEGIERWMAVLEGAGLVLRVGGGTQHLSAESPAFRSGGDAPVEASLLGSPVRAFNLLSGPGQARMVRVAGEYTFRVDGEAVVAVYAQDEPARLVTLEEEIDIPPRHLAWQHRTWRTHGIVRGAHALWMEARP